MEIKLRGHSNPKLRELWLKIAYAYSKGASVVEIAKKTGYSRTHIYWIFRQLRNIKDTNT